MWSTAAEKFLGTILLIAGLSIIGYSLYSGINVFVNVQNPPEIFKPIANTLAPLEKKSISPSASMPKNLNEVNPAEIQKIITDNLINPEVIKSVIPPEMFSYTSRIMNLTVFSLFLWVLITAGSKVAALGIILIKTNSNIKV